MTIRIRTRLLAGFLSLVALMTALAFYAGHVGRQSLENSVGRNSVFLAEEMLKTIDRDIYQKIEALQIHASHAGFQKSLAESNAAFAGLPDVDDWIDRQEKDWVAAPRDQVTPFMDRLMRNELSQNLRREIVQFYENRYGYPVFGEILVTNRFGALTAATGKASDYRQDDEAWWRVARDDGFFVGAVAYDESAGTYALSLGIRILDARGDFAGVMKAVVDTKGIVREAEVTAKRYETTRVRVLTDTGRLIYSSRVFRFLEDFSETPFFRRIQGDNGFFVSMSGGRQMLCAYARSQGYRRFKGLNWILVLGHDVEEVLAPALRLRNRILAASAAFITAAVLIAFFLSRSITGPVARLIRGAEEIGRGNLDYRIAATGKDELGRLAASFNEMAVQRRHAEQTLLESQARFRNFFEAGAIGMVMGDPEGRFVQVNEAFCRMIGYAEAELIGTPFQALVHPEDLASESVELIALLKGQIPHYQREERLIHRQGHYLWVKVSVSLVRDAGGTPLHLIAGITDIGDRRKAEEKIQSQLETIQRNEMELERHRDHLERLVEERTAELMRSNQELEHFAYVASHDLKEPLRKISNFTSMLERRYKGSLDEKADQYIHYVVDGAQRMEGLINDLLLYSRAGRGELEATSVDMEKVFQQTADDLGRAIEEAGAAVDHDPLPVVQGNRRQLGQLFQNLMANALKFRGEQPPRVHISAVKTGDEWIFCVQDNGIGFDPEQQERIFGIFQRLHTRTEYPGTGIGLAVCKKIVERHGGRIWAESAPGRGARFYFSLPGMGD